MMVVMVSNADALGVNGDDGGDANGGGDARWWWW